MSAKQVEVIAVDGLEEAIVGSSHIRGSEVLVYSIEACISIMLSNGYDHAEATETMGELMLDPTPGNPIFMYLTDKARGDSIVDEKRTMH